MSVQTSCMDDHRALPKHVENCLMVALVRFLTYPQQPFGSLGDVVDDGHVLVPLATGDPVEAGGKQQSTRSCAPAVATTALACVQAPHVTAEHGGTHTCRDESRPPSPSTKTLAELATRKRNANTGMQNGSRRAQVLPSPTLIPSHPRIVQRNLWSPPGRTRRRWRRRRISRRCSPPMRPVARPGYSTTPRACFSVGT